MITIVLPMPPSVNALFRNLTGKGRVKTKAYRKWIKAADAEFMTQKRALLGQTPVPSPCEVKFLVPATMRGDASNIIKAGEDWLVSREITADDSKNWEVGVKRVHGLTNCHVIIRTVS
jgi:crossover junction endodeoxyribonuclease RusA